MRTLLVATLVLLAACTPGRIRTSEPSPTIAVRVDNRSRCAVRVKVEQASTLLKSVRVDARSSASFGWREQRPAGPAVYTVEPEQRCGVRPYVIGAARFGESAALTLYDEPALSSLSLAPREVTP